MGSGQSPENSSTSTSIHHYFEAVRHASESIDSTAVETIVSHLVRAHAAGNLVLVAGNGGSASTASHIATDLSKGVRGRPIKSDVQGVKALSLAANEASLTAWANDEGYDMVFAEQVRNFGQPGGILIAISASGQSPNILRAAEAAHEMGMVVIGLIGNDGGKLKPLCDVTVVVPSADYGVIEDVHMSIGHAMSHAIRTHVGGD